MRHTLFRELLAFFDELNAARQGETFDRRKQAVHTSVGMILHPPPLMNYLYDYVPTNSRMFAWTGMEDDHYDFLLHDGEVREDSPVVMGSMGFNNIVGENLRDFLCLGIGTGYEVLCDLAKMTEREEFIQNFPAPGQFGSWVEPEQREILQLLARRFALTPWTDLVEKLDRLNLEFLPQVRHKKAYYALSGESAPSTEGMSVEEALGRKLMKFELFRGGVLLGIVTENTERWQELGYPWYCGWLTPSPGYATVRPLFDERAKLDAEDEAGADRVLRSILQPGVQMREVNTGEVYDVVGIGIYGDEVYWTPFVYRFSFQEETAEETEDLG